MTLSLTFKGRVSPPLSSPQAERARDPLSSLGQSGRSEARDRRPGRGVIGLGHSLLGGGGATGPVETPDPRNPGLGGCAPRAARSLTCWAAPTAGPRPRPAAPGPRRPGGCAEPSAPPSCPAEDSGKENGRKCLLSAALAGFPPIGATGPPSWKLAASQAPADYIRVLRQGFTFALRAAARRGRVRGSWLSRRGGSRRGLRLPRDPLRAPCPPARGLPCASPGPPPARAPLPVAAREPGPPGAAPGFAKRFGAGKAS